MKKYDSVSFPINSTLLKMFFDTKARNEKALETCPTSELIQQDKKTLETIEKKLLVPFGFSLDWYTYKRLEVLYYFY